MLLGVRLCEDKAWAPICDLGFLAERAARVVVTRGKAIVGSRPRGFCATPRAGAGSP